MTYCCSEKKNKEITFQDNDIIVGGNTKKNEIVIYSGSKLCMHKKLLSQCFVKHLDVYLGHLYSDIAKIQFDQGRIDMKIYVVFIEFFKLLDGIFIKLLYFNDCEILCKLVAMADAQLCTMISKIAKPKNFYIATISLNSLLYINNTFNNFLDTIYRSTLTNFTDLKYPEQLRKKEIIGYKYIDNHITTLFAGVKTIKGYNIGEHVYKIIQKNVFQNGYYEFFDEIVSYLIENILSVFFSFLIREKMDPSLAEYVLADITDLKRLIMIRIDKIPFLNIIECYLKIFLIDPQNTKDFIENFRNFGATNYNFAQILKMLNDDSNNVKLFMEYKKIYDEQSQ